jgi:hypothetical protein
MDYLMICGGYQMRPNLPYTPGTDAAGVVIACGERVDRVRPGTGSAMVDNANAQPPFAAWYLLGSIFDNPSAVCLTPAFVEDALRRAGFQHHADQSAQAGMSACGAATSGVTCRRRYAGRNPRIEVSAPQWQEYAKGGHSIRKKLKRGLILHSRHDRICRSPHRRWALFLAPIMERKS